LWKVTKKATDKCISDVKNMTIFSLVLGDLQFDMLNDKKCQTMNDICDVFNLSQLISIPNKKQKHHHLLICYKQTKQALFSTPQFTNSQV
jgi:hypothetical protein